MGEDEKARAHRNLTEPGDFPAPTKKANGAEEFDPAAVAHVLGRSEVIRQRALNAATISGGAAAVLAAVAGLSGIARRSVWVQALVAVALCAWLLSVWINIRVVALPPKDLEQGDHPARDQYENVEKMLDAHRSYSGRLRSRVVVAAWTTAGALLLTATTIVATFIERQATAVQTLALSLQPTTVEALRADCKWKSSPDRVIADVRTDDLGKSMVPLKLGRDECVTRRAVVHVPRRAIRAARQASKQERSDRNSAVSAGG